MKKYILGAVFSLALLASPAFTQAATLTQAQINAIVSLLQSFGAESGTITNVNAALNGETSSSGGGTQPWCHTFNKDLTVGSSGDDVSALYRAIHLSGIVQTPQNDTHIFDEITAGYVVQFQAKYGIPQTGYVGQLTRAKLNALYGCYNTPQPPTVVVQPSITVLSPNGGEVWHPGETHRVLWTPNVVKDVNISIFDSSVSGRGLANNITPNGSAVSGLSGYYDWIIPPLNQLPPFDGNDSTNYKINIQTTINGNTAYALDASDAPFSIVAAPKQLELTIPNNGEKWQIGSTHTIQWLPYDPQNRINVFPIVSAYLERKVNGNFVTVGKVQEDGKASIHWSGLIGDTPQQSKFADPGEYYIRIVNSQTGEWDRSDVPFTLVAQNTIKADLKINDLDTSWDAPFALPAGGGNVTLSWTSTNADSCKLYFNGFADDLSGLPTSGKKNVFLKQNPYPNTISISLSCISPIGETFDNVYIAAANTDSKITILSPNGGEAINLSSTYPITWISSKDIANVAIALYKNDAFYRWIVATSLPVQSTNGSLAWDPSTTLSSLDANAGYAFKIYIIGYKTGGGTVEDKSDAPFSIISVAQQAFQVSTGGRISQKLHYAPSSNSFYGIGSDNAVWKWDDSAKQWSRLTDGSIKDDFHFISESDIYAIGLDNQIWHWNGTRWSQVSEGGKIQQKIWYVDGNHIYGIGMDNQVWRWGSAGGWVKITSNGHIKDDFHFISEDDIYGIGLDGQIWRWHGAPTSAWRQISSGGTIKQKLHFISQTEMYGIGTDNKIWKWSNGSWSALYGDEQIKDDFVIVGGNAAYAIGMDNQIWKLTITTLGSGKSRNDTVGSAYSNLGLAGALGAFSGNGGKPGNDNADPAPVSTSSFSYAWNRDLQIGSPYNEDIAALQQALAREGVYAGEITGGFYNQTYTAVQAFQRKYDINATGYVGSVTRAKLNALY